MPCTPARSIAGVCESVRLLHSPSIELHHSIPLLNGALSSKESYTNIAPSVRRALSIELTERKNQFAVYRISSLEQDVFLYLRPNGFIDSCPGVMCMLNFINYIRLMHMHLITTKVNVSFILVRAGKVGCE